MNPLLSNNEAAKLVDLHQYQILDTSAEQAFDDLAFLAAQICATPIALINLIDANRQCFKARVGLDVKEMPVDIGFCPLCVQQRDVLIIPDTLNDERFATSPVVTSAPYVRFYAGVPLITSEGQALGTICVVDHVPRKINQKQVESLKAISRLVMKQLESRQTFTQITSVKAEYQQAQIEEKFRWKEALLHSITGVSPLAFYVVDHLTGHILYVNERFCQIWGIEHLKEQIESGKLKHLDIMKQCCELTKVSPFISCQPIPSQVCILCEDEILLNDGRTIKRFSKRIREENDQYFLWLYIFEDITVHKLAEQQVREQAALLDITTDAMTVRDLNNRILLWNKSAENLYGWQAQETLGKNAEDILHHEPLPQHREIYKNVLESGSWQGELQTMTKSGKEIIVKSHWTIIRDEHFQPKSILVVDTDITQKRQLEKIFYAISAWRV